MNAGRRVLKGDLEIFEKALNKKCVKDKIIIYKQNIISDTLIP